VAGAPLPIATSFPVDTALKDEGLRQTVALYRQSTLPA
jgi:hypothetical protein